MTSVLTLPKLYYITHINTWSCRGHKFYLFRSYFSTVWEVWDVKRSINSPYILIIVFFSEYHCELSLGSGRRFNTLEMEVNLQSYSSIGEKLTDTTNDSCTKSIQHSKLANCWYRVWGREIHTGLSKAMEEEILRLIFSLLTT